jgi:TonB-dependent receptor
MPVRLLLLSGACGLAMSLPAFAQSDDLETVVVTGEKYALERSIDTKRANNVVSDGISSDEIGSIPEFGLGDALRKVPGLSLQINNGRGEDQFLTVRGLNPDYNSIEIDGLQLPSTEETRRQVSLDVIPSVVVSQVGVAKSWSAEQVSDAVGGVTMLKTRSAFDHPGQHIDAHLDYAYWEDEPVVTNTMPSLQGDVTYSNTFGDDNQYGLVLLASYMRRSSSTLNTYTLPYSYYPYAGSGTVNTAALDQAAGSATTATGATLKPTDDLTGLIPIPDRHRWYFYDNDRTRPGVFGRFDFDDHQMLHAHVSAGEFEFINDEHRYSQYLNRVGNATITSPTTGSFAQGAPETDYDKYVQYRELTYVDAGAGMTLAPGVSLELTANYGVGHYKQTTAEDQFTAPTSATYGFTYDLAAPQAPLFIPNNSAAFMNPANYNEVYHLDAVDKSTSHLPQVKAELSDNFDADSDGLGLRAGFVWRDLTQDYSYNQARYNPVGTAPTLAQLGTIPVAPTLYDGQGQTLLFVDPNAVGAFVTANPARYVRNASDTLSNAISNFHLEEAITSGYLEAQYRWGPLYALAGVRIEGTDLDILNYQPVPFSSTTNFVQGNTNSGYTRVLPSLNVSYDLADDLKLRAAITQTLGRPTYSQLAQNGSASVSGTTASESISNPSLKPRESTNIDLSAEYYPAPGMLMSVAMFDKQIRNEIVTLTTTVNNATVPGTPTPVTLTITQAANTDSAHVQGIEFGFSDVHLGFLPGLLSNLGVNTNVAFVDMDAPHIRMSNGTLRQLPQLLESSRFTGNASLLYSDDVWSGEIAYNYTSKMPISFDTNNAANDQWWAGISTLDAQITYKFSDYLSLRAQGKNLTDSVPQKVVGVNQQLNYSALENGRAFYFGVAVAF